MNDITQAAGSSTNSTSALSGESVEEYLFTEAYIEIVEYEDSGGLPGSATGVSVDTDNGDVSGFTFQVDYHYELEIKFKGVFQAYVFDCGNVSSNFTITASTGFISNGGNARQESFQCTGIDGNPAFLEGDVNDGLNNAASSNNKVSGTISGQPDPLTVTLQSSNPNYSYIDLTATASGGTGGYTFDWYILDDNNGLGTFTGAGDENNRYEDGYGVSGDDVQVKVTDSSGNTAYDEIYGIFVPS